VSGLYTDLTFPAPPPDRPYVYINMVMSLDGKATIDKTERGLGSARDQRLMRELRLHADMVMNGANTLRISGTSSTLGDEDLVHLRRKRRGDRAPIAAVITSSGDLPLQRRFFTSREFDAIVFATEGIPSDRLDAIRATGRRAVLLPAGVHTLPAMVTVMRRELGIQYLLVEGGPTLNAGLLQHGLVDELFLTMAGKIVGGSENLSIVEGPQFPIAGVPQFEAISSYYNEDDREFYFRWRTLPQAG
jgi:riboflavin-specific deaminase-like protein